VINFSENSLVYACSTAFSVLSVEFLGEDGFGSGDKFLSPKTFGLSMVNMWIINV